MCKKHHQPLQNILYAEWGFPPNARPSYEHGGIMSAIRLGGLVGAVLSYGSGFNNKFGFKGEMVIKPVNGRTGVFVFSFARFKPEKWVKHCLLTLTVTHRFCNTGKS